MTSRYTLPALPFADDALEPWCSAETLHLHHDKHHKAYVDKANEAAAALDQVDPEDHARLAGLQQSLTFNLGGHQLHALFWDSLSPDVNAPTGPLAERIASDFGSLDRLTILLSTIGVDLQGSGWVALAADRDGRLLAGSIHDHQHGHLPQAGLVAVVDVWEHAYYLDHRNDRAAWLAAALRHLDWQAAGARYDAIVAGC